MASGHVNRTNRTHGRTDQACNVKKAATGNRFPSGLPQSRDVRLGPIGLAAVERRVLGRAWNVGIRGGRGNPPRLAMR